MRKLSSFATLGAFALAAVAMPYVASGECWGTSPASSAELTIHWESLDALPSLETAAAPVVTGEGTEGTPASAPADAAPKAAALDKPLLVFVCEPGSTDCEECEKNLLEDDRIELGAKAFRAVKMSPDAAKADAILKEKGGKAVPRVVLVSSDLKTIKVLEAGTLKVSEVWGSMKTVANKHYKQDLDGVVKGLKDVCNEFNKLYAETKVLDEKEKRLTDKATPADRKEIETKRSALEERQKKVEAQRDKLLELKPKASKA